MPEIILAIDPGETQSGWVLMDVATENILAAGKMENEILKRWLGRSDYPEGCLPLVSMGDPQHIVIEYPEPRGQRMFSQLVTTIFWIGRFVEAWGGEWDKVDRKQVFLRMCGSPTGNDAAVSAAVRCHYDKRPDTGGGSKPSVGIKSDPGPLYDVKKDAWQALGALLTYLEMRGEGIYEWKDNEMGEEMLR